MTDTLAANRQDYIEKAVALATDLPRLDILRRALRPAMLASKLCDGAAAATALQTLLRDIWQAHCRDNG